MRNKNILIGVFIFFIFMLLSYAGYTARHLIQGPKIYFEGAQSALVSTERLFTLHGSTQSVQELFMNKKLILLNEAGDFTQKALLSTGKNIFIFDAKDRFGRMTQNIITVIYTPPEEAVVQ